MQISLRFACPLMCGGAELAPRSRRQNDIAPALEAYGRSLTRFHMVSCQFALHYAFASQCSANTFFRTVAAALLPGYYFIATLPNAPQVVSVCPSDRQAQG